MGAMLAELNPVGRVSSMMGVSDFDTKAAIVVRDDLADLAAKKMAEHESPEKLALVQRVTTAYLRRALGVGDED
jgi:hypothetical protein